MKCNEYGWVFFACECILFLCESQAGNLLHCDAVPIRCDDVAFMVCSLLFTFLIVTERKSNKRTKPIICHKTIFFDSCPVLCKDFPNADLRKKKEFEPVQMVAKCNKTKIKRIPSII